MDILPEQYIINKFYENAGYVKYNSHNHTYQGGCPICREGKSWGLTSRCYYIPRNNNIYCHNCGWSSKPLKWISQVTGMPRNDILKDAKTDVKLIRLTEPTPKEIKKVESCVLPTDAINLLDEQQIMFYLNKKSRSKVLQVALQYIEDRRLKTAVNKSSLFLSLADVLHKNRIIIPFYDTNKHLIYYQSRTLLSSDDKPKYISSTGFNKSIFGIDKIDPLTTNIFILEGPIDSMFIKDAVAIGGIQKDNKSLPFNHLQQQQLAAFPLQKRIWVLDSQWLDETALQVSKTLIDLGEAVFIWPQKLGTVYKDINAWCQAEKRDEIEHSFILDNTFEGLHGKLKLSKIS